MERRPVSPQEQDRNVFDLADEVVTNRIVEGLEEATKRMDKAFGEGHCNCPSCKKEAVSEMNNLLEFIDPKHNYPRYFIGDNFVLMQEDLSNR